MGEWRTAGIAEFAFTTEAIRFIHGTGLLRIAIASLAMMMLPLALVMQFNPMGPHGVVLRTVQVGSALLGFGLGLQWLKGRWPTARQAIKFLLLADLLIGVAASVLSDPTARICGAIHLAMLGLFAAFFLGWRVLLVHCIYSLLLIGGLTAYAIAFDGRTLLDLYVYTTPAIATVVGLPVIIQVVVEAGRAGITRVSKEWYMDSLTGVYNRRGMDLAVRRATARHGGSDGVFVVGALDLDEFKLFNDTRGHFAGDELLSTVAARLHSVPRLIVARNGGDEFSVLAIRSDAEAAQRTVEQLRALVRQRTGGPEAPGLPASMGIVLAPVDDRDRLDSLAADADEALYEAKRSATDAVIVRRPGHVRGDG
ncbi:GGDEF domain-containing protein [Tsukamurella spumae]|uniref:GGDEF domain-containing protein n=1 Tax=Tsukamurella spumae TaxID=44753 RepID=A0A846WV85_9ACTN|nr:GGDEF domain-containing protein [Tsukamurella spumae]NKY16923.1 GGDEF domain-containing protein [Tsukamurella spumae]